MLGNFYCPQAAYKCLLHLVRIAIVCFSLRTASVNWVAMLIYPKNFLVVTVHYWNELHLVIITVVLTLWRPGEIVSFYVTILYCLSHMSDS